MSNFPRKEKCRGKFYDSDSGENFICNKIILRKHAGETLCPKCRKRKIRIEEIIGIYGKTDGFQVLLPEGMNVDNFNQSW